MTAGIIAGCSSENTVDKTTLKFGVTNFADTLEPTQNYFGWVVMRYAIGECLTKFDEKWKFSHGLRKVGLLVMTV